jgi:hypothetical protein
MEGQRFEQCLRHRARVPPACLTAPLHPKEQSEDKAKGTQSKRDREGREEREPK